MRIGVRVPYFDELFLKRPSGAYQQRTVSQSIDIGYVSLVNKLLRNNGIISQLSCKPLVGGDLHWHFEQQRITEQKRHVVNATIPVLYA